MRLKIQHTLLLIVALASLLSSCKTISKSNKTTDSRLEQQSAEKMSAKELVQYAQTAQPAFERAYVKKMSINLQAKGREINVNATCKLVTDSAIHLSIQPFMGIELFKLELSPNSMIVIDKMNKMYYESNYGIFYELLGISIRYSEIQALISNRFFVAGERIVQPRDFTLKVGKDLTLTNQNENIQQETTLDNTGRIINLWLKEMTKNWVMTTQYSSFKNFDKVLFPEKINITATEDEKVKGKFSFVVGEVEFDRNFRMKPAKKTRYRRGDIRTLLNK